MRRYNYLFVFLAGLTLVFCLGCQKNNIQGNPDTTKFIERLNVMVPGRGNGDISQEDIQVVIDMLNGDVLPAVTGEAKKASLDIVAYLEGIKDKVPGYLTNEDNLIEASRAIMRISLLLARIRPDDFDANLNISANYISLATSLGGDRYSSDKLKRLNKEFNEKGVQAAKALVESFPDNPMSYGQLAHTAYYTGGDEKEVIRILNKCIEVDKKSKYCKEFLDKVKGE